MNNFGDAQSQVELLMYRTETLLNLEIDTEENSWHYQLSCHSASHSFSVEFDRSHSNFKVSVCLQVPKLPDRNAPLSRARAILMLT